LVVEGAAEGAPSARRSPRAHHSRSLGFRLRCKTQELWSCRPPNPRKVAGELLRSRISSRSPASCRTTPPHAWLAGALRALLRSRPCVILHARREKARRASPVAPSCAVRVVLALTSPLTVQPSTADRTRPAREHGGRWRASSRQRTRRGIVPAFLFTIALSATSRGMLCPPLERTPSGDGVFRIPSPARKSQSGDDAA